MDNCAYLNLKNWNIQIFPWYFVAIYFKTSANILKIVFSLAIFQIKKFPKIKIE